MRSISIVFCVFVVLLSVNIAQTTIIHVPAEQPTIQAGINGAVNGDTVLLANGTYTGEGNRNVNYNGKAITVMSESEDPEVCIIDCQGSGRGFVFQSNETLAALLEGVTITNATNAGYAGAILCNQTSPTISNCYFSENYANFGAVIYSCGTYSEHNHPALINCIFSENSAGTGGGGMACEYSSPTLVNCRFVNNHANYGGAMYCNYSSPILICCSFTGNTVGYWGQGGAIHLHAPYGSGPNLTKCEFSENSASGQQGYGGAIDIYDGVPVQLTECVFTQNSAKYGGGIYNIGNNLTLMNCVFSHNVTEHDGGGIYHENSSSSTFTNCFFSNDSAGEYGGGMFCRSYFSDSSHPVLTNCSFSGNSAVIGGGMHCYGDISTPILPTFTNCTFSGNRALHGSGISFYDESYATLKNTIIAFGIEGEAVYCDSTSTDTFAYCDIYGNGGGDWVGCIGAQYGINGNISCDPMFCYPDTGNYHLKSCSCCKGAGCDSLGNPNSTFNIGAFPVGCDYLNGDVNGDKVIDIGDVIYLINYLFKSGPTPTPLPAGDATCDGNVDVGDVVYLINYLFKGGPAPSC